MKSWEIDWYRELLDRVLAEETLSEDDHCRLNYFMDRGARETAESLILQTLEMSGCPPSTFYVRNPGEAAMMRVPGVVR